MQPRYYQQAAHDAAIEHLKKSLDSQVLVLPCGSGKSLIISMIARTVWQLSKKRVLCTAPTAKLVEQNHAKYLSYGLKASVFCASLKRKELRHDVVFGSTLSLLNSADKLKDFGAIIIDECDGITPTVKKLIKSLKKTSPNLRVIGLTASPYRMGTGYIYTGHYQRGIEEQAKNPYFKLCTYEIKTHELIEAGYLNPAVVGEIHAGHYDTSGLVMKNGLFTAESVDKAFVGHGRLTADIVADIVAQSKGYRGVMIFGSTQQHCEEILASLPPDLSCLATSKDQAQRLQAEADFLAQRKKYIVNINTQTVGNDYPHADMICLLRKTESKRLLLQIFGRGTRLYPGKDHFKILDYADNVEDGDVFNPKIEVNDYEKSDSVLTAECPTCEFKNQFTPVKNEERRGIDKNGYFVDLQGYRCMTEYGPEPAHFGRRCQNLTRNLDGSYSQCAYRWTFKPCPACEAENDIAARYCAKCKQELVNPNDKLIADFKAMKKDPTQVQCDKVISMEARPHIARSGNECLKVDFVTEYRRFTIWIRYGTWDHTKYKDAMENGIETVTYRKDPESQFFRVIGYNQEADDEPKEKERCKWCGGNLSLGPGSGPHAASLICDQCGKLDILPGLKTGDSYC